MKEGKRLFKSTTIPAEPAPHSYPWGHLRNGPPKGASSANLGVPWVHTILSGRRPTGGQFNAKFQPYLPGEMALSAEGLLTRLPQSPIPAH